MSPTDTATHPTESTSVQSMLEPTPERRHLDRRILDRAVSDLVQRGHLEEKASHSYVIEFLADALARGLDPLPPKPKASLEEIRAIISSLQEEVRKANPEGRDILEEFLAERRAEAARE